MLTNSASTRDTDSSIHTVLATGNGVPSSSIDSSALGDDQQPNRLIGDRNVMRFNINDSISKQNNDVRVSEADLATNVGAAEGLGKKRSAVSLSAESSSDRDEEVVYFDFKLIILIVHT
jgi:hypothetical protein